MPDSSRHRSTRAAVLIAIGAALLLSVPALFGGELPVAGQTAGPVATRAAPIVAGPQNGGVAVAPSFSSGETVSTLNAAAQAAATPVAAAAQPVQAAAPPGPVAGRGASLPPPNQVFSPAAASETGQGNANAARPAANLNLTPASGVSLIAGRSILFVPPAAASCAASAELAYSRDQATFSATCGAGGALSLAQPALLCMEPSPQVAASALGNLENLSITADHPLPTHRSPNGVLVCADARAPGAYTLSVSRKDLPRAALHSLPQGMRVNLPAVGAGGLLDR